MLSGKISRPPLFEGFVCLYVSSITRIFSSKIASLFTDLDQGARYKQRFYSSKYVNNTFKDNQMSLYKIRRLITSGSLFTVTLIIIVGKNPKRFIASDRFSHNFMSPDAQLGMDKIFNGLEHAVNLIKGEANFSWPELHLTIYFNEKQTFCSLRHI